MKLKLYEEKPEKLHPLSATRRCCDIPIGGYTLREYLEKHGHEIVETNEEFRISERSIPCKEALEKIAKHETPRILEYPQQAVIEGLRTLKDNVKDMKGHVPEITGEAYISGEVIFGKNVKIEPFAVIKGPCIIEDDCVIKSHACIEKSHIGKMCKIGGEVEESIILPYTNKQHYGFIGHSIIGSWVNLGAGTQNSDLKNTYGTIKVKGKETNEQFVGTAIGDYSKTSIGTLIFSGKTIGVNSMVKDTVTEDVGDFVMIDKKFDITKAIEIQKRMFKRRNVIQREEDIALLKKIHG